MTIKRATAKKELEFNMNPEIELFNHANICLEFFNENKDDNADVAAYLGARYLFVFSNKLIERIMQCHILN